MGEQPIFTTKAHVFQIDPGTKKKWLPSCSQAISVSYYYDSIRNTYRIISVDGTKALINSTITPTMTFTKTSQKFGQWSDHRSNTVYGLGCSSELDLNKFVDKFKEVKELMRQSESDAPTNGSSSTPEQMTNHITSSSITDKSLLPKPSPSSSPKLAKSNNINDLTNTTPERHSTPNLNATIGGTSTSVVDQLKYENDRLKLALAQSSANAKKWEVELQTLKNNNARLTTALQESTSNVEEWKRQLAAYKEESARMKKKVLEMEKGSGGSGTELLQRQVSDMREKVTSSERLVQEKEQEVGRLTIKMDSMRLAESKNKQLGDQIKTLESEKAVLASQVHELQSQRDSIEAAHVKERQSLTVLQQHLAKLTSQLYETSDKMADTLKTQSHS